MQYLVNFWCGVASSGIVFAFLLGLATVCGAQETAAGWKAGAARVDITPEEPLWMGGYAGRDHAAEGTLLPLNAKALALEDAAGNRAVLVTADLLGFTKDVSDRIRDRVQADFGLPRARVILSASHTHSGPLMRANLNGVYPVAEQDIAAIAAYQGRLEEKVVGVVGEALAALAPVQVSSANGVVRFAVNRRNNPEGTILEMHELKGPFDHAVPVLKLTRPDGQLVAVAFGYACHGTVLDSYQWCGDYPGYAQAELERMYPGATALFFAGCGADQNPLPRRKVTLAQQYGRELAAAVDRVLQDGGAALEPKLTAEYAEIELALQPVPTREELAQRVEKTGGYEQRCAKTLLDDLDAGIPLKQTYPYPVQVWRLGSQTLVILGGEVVVDFAVAVKRALDANAFVMAYANDVMAYIPSVRILKEGGYEGASSQIGYGLAAPWAEDVESRVMAGIRDMATRAGCRWTDAAATP